MIRNRERFALYAILFLIVFTAITSKAMNFDRRLSQAERKVAQQNIEIDDLRADLDYLRSER
jgi:hypothetical protein